jgi:hypothetical protein
LTWVEQERRDMEAGAARVIAKKGKNDKAGKAEEEEEEEGIEAAVGGAAGAMQQEAELDTLREEAERAMVQVRVCRDRFAANGDLRYRGVRGAEDYDTGALK